MSNVMIVEDDQQLREALTDTLELTEHTVFAASNAQDALDKIKQQTVDIVISDVRMDGMDGHQLLKEIHRCSPGIPVILMTAYGVIHQAVDAMKHGAVDYILKPFDATALIEKINYYATPVNPEGERLPVIQDPRSQALMALAKKVAPTDATVLISGESGTGKEVLARYIHDHSERKKKPFIAINCAAIPEQMLEATLFGYEKGAFTGAYKSTPGKFEQANGGTLLLDEISEMDLALQAKLLRVLQEREVERIGGNKLISLDVRLLATTNRDMKEEILNQRFREDLYYRLNVFPLHWIPLRERRQDILPLAEYLIVRHWQDNQGPKPVLSDAAKKALEDYLWPGNAREMDNVIQRALILMSGSVIEACDLHLTSEVNLPYHKDQATTLQENHGLEESKKKHEFEIIKEVLLDVDGNRKKACHKLGISERTLRYKLAEMRQLGYAI